MEMMIFVQLVLFTCACALSGAQVPPYVDIANSISKAHNIISENILSIDGNVPLLNDPRRHYVEIIYVVHYEAMSEDSCIGHNYYEDYQKNINNAGPFAIARPQKVVDGTKKVIQDIIERVDKILQLINEKTQAMTASNQSIDEAIDEEINNNIEKYGIQKQVFLALGLVATQINNNHETYYGVESQNLSAHSFIINGVDKLKKHVMATKNLYRILYSPPELVAVAC